MQFNQINQNTAIKLLRSKKGFLLGLVLVPCQFALSSSATIISGTFTCLTFGSKAFKSLTKQSLKWASFGIFNNESSQAVNVSQTIQSNSSEVAVNIKNIKEYVNYINTFLDATPNIVESVDSSIFEGVKSVSKLLMTESKMGINKYNIDLVRYMFLKFKRNQGEQILNSEFNSDQKIEELKEQIKTKITSELNSHNPTGDFEKNSLKNLEILNKLEIFFRICDDYGKPDPSLSGQETEYKLYSELKASITNQVYAGSQTQAPTQAPTEPQLSPSAETLGLKNVFFLPVRIDGLSNNIPSPTPNAIIIQSVRSQVNQIYSNNQTFPMPVPNPVRC